MLCKSSTPGKNASPWRDSGTLAIFVGLSGAGFAVWMLSATALFRLIMAFDPAVQRSLVGAPWRVILGILWLHMPLWLIGGIWLAAWGNRLRKGNLRALRPLRLGAWLSVCGVIGWGLQCMWITLTICELLPPPADTSPAAAWAIAAASAIGSLALPVILLVHFARTLDHASKRWAAPVE